MKIFLDWKETIHHAAYATIEFPFIWGVKIEFKINEEAGGYVLDIDIDDKGISCGKKTLADAKNEALDWLEELAKKFIDTKEAK